MDVYMSMCAVYGAAGHTHLILSFTLRFKSHHRTTTPSAAWYRRVDLRYRSLALPLEVQALPHTCIAHTNEPDN